MESRRLTDDFLEDLADLSESDSDSPVIPPLPSLPVQPILTQSILEEVAEAIVRKEVRPDLLAAVPPLIAQIDQEVLTLYQHIREVYGKRFPELETQCQSPVEYCRLAFAIQNESDISKLDLSGLIPSTKLIALAISLSSTAGKLLSPSDLSDLHSSCTHVSLLTSQKSQLSCYSEYAVTSEAPNLCELLGNEVASKVLSTIGGLKAMLSTPACVIQVLGQQKGPTLGLSTTGAGTIFGFLANAEIVRKAPETIRKKAIRILAAKTVLAARVDYFKSAAGGEEGRRLKAEVVSRLEKAVEGPPESQKRPLPVPADRPKQHRGGQRVRAAKRKFQMTELRKYANRVKMGVEAQDEYRDTGEGFGMLGASGKLRIKTAAQPIGLSSKKRRQMTFHSSGTESGLTSAFAFSQTQDLQLENPEKSVFAKPNSVYFAPTSGFATVLAEKLKAKK